MSTLTGAKLQQATVLVAAADVDVWLIFDRETAEGGDPVLPLILEGGLTWQSALMIGRDGRRLAVVGNFDAAPIEASGDWDEVVGYVADIRAPLISALEGLVGDQAREPRIAVNYSTDDDKCDGLSHGLFLQLEAYLRETRFAGCLVSAEEIVRALRSRKIAPEITRLRAAIEVTEQLFTEVTSYARIGITERQVYEFVQRRIDAQGLGYGWERTGNPMVNSGPDSMLGHGRPSAEISIQPGHILHLDLGVIVEGYSSDIQRCWYVPAAGEVTLPDDVQRALAAVAGTISAGAETLRPGIEGWRVDEVARNFLTAAGYPEFQHALGHQVGRLAHDGGGTLGPRWERYGRMPDFPVEVDQVYTIELGVVVEGRGYLGLEEMVRVTADGCEWLTDRQLQIPLLG